MYVSLEVEKFSQWCRSTHAHMGMPPRTTCSARAHFMCCTCVKIYGVHVLAANTAMYMTL